MATKIVLIFAVIVGMITLFPAPAVPSPLLQGWWPSGNGKSSGMAKNEMDSEIEKIREAIIEQDVTIALDSNGRFFAGGPNGFGNLSSIIASAPTTSAAFTFIPLATILFGAGR